MHSSQRAPRAGRRAFCGSTLVRSARYIVVENGSHISINSFSIIQSDKVCRLGWVEFAKPINQRYECLYGIQPNQRSMRVWHAAGVNLRIYFRFHTF